MAIASSLPILRFAESVIAKVSAVGKGTPASWWLAILTLGPLLGSFITGPAAMTICALLLRHRFYSLKPSAPLKYATLGLLFVNISVGGVLTQFASPPVVMVANVWHWDLLYMLTISAGKPSSESSCPICFISQRFEENSPDLRLACQTKSKINRGGGRFRGRSLVSTSSFYSGQ